MFRFDASTPVNDVFIQIAKSVYGSYQKPDYFFAAVTGKGIRWPQEVFLAFRDGGVIKINRPTGIKTINKRNYHMDTKSHFW